MRRGESLPSTPPRYLPPADSHQRKKLTRQVIFGSLAPALQVSALASRAGVTFLVLLKGRCTVGGYAWADFVPDQRDIAADQRPVRPQCENACSQFAPPAEPPPQSRSISLGGIDAGSQNRKTAELHYIYVGAAHRGGGAGRMLFEAIEEAAVRAGCATLELIADNSAEPEALLRFYTSLGAPARLVMHTRRF
eukprot:SAG11_NODE_3578_length_2358_cov_3.440018_4_plen_193_part_00